MACKLNFWFDLNQTLTRGWVYLLPIIGDCSKNQNRPTLRIRHDTPWFLLLLPKRQQTQTRQKTMLFWAMQPFRKAMLRYFKSGRLALGGPARPFAQNNRSWRLRPSSDGRCGKRSVGFDQTELSKLGPEFGRDFGLQRIVVLL